MSKGIKRIYSKKQKITLGLVMLIMVTILVRGLIDGRFLYSALVGTFIGVLGYMLFKSRKVA